MSEYPDNKEGIERLQEALLKDPSNEKHLNALGQALYLEKRYDEAIEALKRGLEFHPPNLRD